MVHGGSVLHFNIPHFKDASVILDGTCFRSQPVDTETIILTMKDLNDTNSVGSDGISLMFIKDSLYFAVFYLTCIIDTSIVTGVFSTSWKHALVVPIFKNGDNTGMDNYRPISLLPIVSKILEKVVAGSSTSSWSFITYFLIHSTASVQDCHSYYGQNIW